jgi:hypothetical protein
MTESVSMAHEEFIHDFESDANPARAFLHADHVRLAFAYLSLYPVLQALDRFSSALKRFAEARGKTRLYHETITCAYLFLIHERMASREHADWDEFVCRNPDLFAWRGGILNRYYADGTLHSDLARKVFVLPDKGLHEITQSRP